MTRLPHISVCICTYRRPELLKRLLTELGRQETQGLFDYSVVVVDNDQRQSANNIVSEYHSTSSLEIDYCVEPQQNIALARNRAVENAKGDFIAFIDDDELPIKDWLFTLFKTCNKYGVDGVLGPVKPYFEEEPPQWVVKGKFYDRPSYHTGFVIDWRKGRTGNALLKREMFNLVSEAFNPEFLTGEDQDFYRRMIEKGCIFVWCNEAIAYEIVPPIRWKRTFILRRALLRGKVSLKHPTFGAFETVKSIAAVSVYAIALPFLILLGQHVFMSYLEKTFTHLGKLIRLLGFDPVREVYITE